MARGIEAAEDDRAWYDALIESGVVALFRKGADGTIEAITQAAAVMLGYASAEEALADGRNVRDLYADPSQRDLLLRALVESGRVHGYEVRVRRIDGETKWVEVDAVALTDAGGRLVALEGSMVDRTERHRMTAILAAIRLAGERLLRAGWREDLPALLRALGEAAEVDRAFLVGNLGSPDDRPQVLGAWQSGDDLPVLDDAWAEGCFASGPAAAERLRMLREGLLHHHGETPGPREACALGEEIEACVMVPVANGHIWAALGFQSGVHREWAAQEMNALRSAASMLAAAVAREEAEERYRQLVEQIPVVVYEAAYTFDDVATQWQYVSPRIGELTGYTAEEWLADPSLWPDSLHQEDRERVFAEEERAAHAMEPLTVEYRLRSRDGSWRWVRDAAEPVLDGSLIFRGVMVDLTPERVALEEAERNLSLLAAADSQRRRLMRDLEEAQEQEKARIAEDLHDDPIQALTAIGLRLDLLRQAVRDDAESAAIVQQIREAVGDTIGRLRHMMFELRPRSLDEGGLMAALRDSLAGAIEEGGIVFRLMGGLDREPSSSARVTAFRIVQEAVANVRKHSQADACRVIVRTHPRGVLLEVHDDGIGFDPGDEIRSPVGHMGLSAMRERAESAGGWLTVLSEPGSGTALRCLVPDPPMGRSGAGGEDDAIA